jgi:hypothetical protein
MTTWTPDKQYLEQAQAIANLAQAIADNTLVGPRYAAVLRMREMVSTLVSWTGDDRS